MNGRSIQDIVPPARSKPLRSPNPGTTPTDQSTSQPPMTPPPHRNEEAFGFNDDKKNPYLFIGIAAGAVAVVAIIVVLMSTVFRSANVTVSVSEWKNDVSGSYQAGGAVPLSYQPVVINDSVSKSVPATGTENAQDHASGTIVITNLGKAQRLITNTRFQSKDGHLFRIHTPVTVPAATTKGTTKVPGTIEAVVYADEAGDKYNLGITDFTIPGLKGSPQFTQVTGHSKAAFTGGFVGTRATVEKSVHDQTVQDLKADLDRRLRDTVVAQTPAGSIVFPDSIDITYTEAPVVADGGNATLTMNATAIAPAFGSDALARELATHAGITTDSPLMLVNPKDVAYSLATGGNVQGGGAITFTLTGAAHLVAAFNQNKFATDIAGKSQAEVERIRADYPALTGAITVKVYPFWFSTLPKSADLIKVVTRGSLDQQP